MRKWLLCCLFVVLCLGGLVFPCYSADVTPPTIPATGDVWDGVTITAPSKIVNKDGVNYYEINTCAELAYVAQEGGVWTGKNYLLLNDLILNDVELQWDADGNLQNDPATLKKWTPIGNSQNPFTGTFNGDGHTISGMYVSTRDTAGLFGLITGTIKNVTVVNADVTVTGGGGGGICGQCGSCIGCTYFGAVKSYDDYAGGISGSCWNGSCIGCTSYGVVSGKGLVGGICGYGGCSDCTNYSEITGTGAKVGGICGGNEKISVINGTNYGAVNGGKEKIGGICGYCRFTNPTDCRNYGDVNGSSYQVGGICGEGTHCEIIGCINYGAITGSTSAIGGICGYLSAYQNIISDCANSGAITGSWGVGGIVGSVYNSYDTRYPSGTISRCANTATVTGTNNVGGICGTGDYETVTVISNSLNTGKITGESNVGGIAGNLDKDTVINCYSIGNIECSVAGNNAGAIVGSEGAAWGQDTVTGCYYLATDGVFGCGGVISAEYEPDGILACSEAAMKIQSTYTGWDFVNTWAISSAENDGYPYLLSLKDNGNVKPLEEYYIGVLTIRDANGTALTTIPSGSFLVTVPIMKQTGDNDAMVLLASYTAAGQYRGLMYVTMEDVPVGGIIKITLPVDNAKGDIARLKAFAIPSFSDLTPLGPASVFPAE